MDTSAQGQGREVERKHFGPGSMKKNKCGVGMGDAAKQQDSLESNILLFICQRHEDAKKQQKQDASLGLYPGRHG